MLKQGSKFRTPIIAVLIVFGTVKWHVLINTKILAESLSESTENSPCIETKIQLYIQKLNQDSPSSFDQLVACDSKAVPALILALKNEDPSVRSNAADALGRIGKMEKLTIPALILAQGDEDPSVRSNAKDAIEKIRKKVSSNIHKSFATRYNLISADARELKNSITIHLQKPPLMCSWIGFRCPDTSQISPPSRKPENPPPSRKLENPPLQKPK